MFYDKELDALKRSGRFRQRKIFDESILDLASNDYLGLASNKEIFQNTVNKLQSEKFHSPKASMLVNGYSKFHKEFEDLLCEANGFEAGVVVGSGFLANISMIEALIRKGDKLFIDEEYHASGVLASKLLNKDQVVVFKHNNIEDLESKLEAVKYKRAVIAIEGIYSMSGDLCKKDIFKVADDYEAILIVDEAHSSGVIGENLLGVYDFFGITPKSNHIKMGTLGKAYGSYGAYILASAEIVSFLENRAKPIIYATAPSLFDTVMGCEALKYIIRNKKEIKLKIKQNRTLVKEELEIDMPGLIVPIVIGDNRKVLDIQDSLKQIGYLVGAIREPTVNSAIIRLIAKIDINEQDLRAVCKKLNFFLEKRE
jgi:8-amino-7-oxononanoate synthase